MRNERSLPLLVPVRGLEEEVGPECQDQPDSTVVDGYRPTREGLAHLLSIPVGDKETSLATDLTEHEHRERDADDERDHAQSSVQPPMASSERKVWHISTGSSIGEPIEANGKRVLPTTGMVADSALNRFPADRKRLPETIEHDSVLLSELGGGNRLILLPAAGRLDLPRRSLPRLAWTTMRGPSTNGVPTRNLHVLPFRELDWICA